MIRILTKIVVYLSSSKLNLLATFIVNFKMCSLRDACKFPILIYGKVSFDHLLGRIEFPKGCHHGMVVFGKNLGHFGGQKSGLYIFMNRGSKLIFEGKAFFAFDVNVRLSQNAVMTIGDNVRIGDSVNLFCEYKVTISQNTEITFGGQVCDTNFHYMIDLTTKNIQRKHKQIYIGKNNWIGNHSFIAKGCMTPDWCTVASGSLINKDYRDEGEYIVLAGTPAKTKKRGVKRIFDFNQERIIDNYFEGVSDSSVFLDSLK